MAERALSQSDRNALEVCCSESWLGMVHWHI